MKVKKLEWIETEGNLILASKPQRYSGVWGTIDVEYKITREGDWIDNAYWIAGREVPKTMSMTHVEHATLSVIIEKAKKDFQKQHEEFLELFSKDWEDPEDIPRRVGFEDELIRLVKAIHGDCSDARDLIGEYIYDVFEMRSFLWDCDEDCEEDDEGNKDYSKCKLNGWCEKPNFHYKPTDLQITWYKYPLRSATSNRKMTLDEFARIIDHCIEAYKLESKQGAQDES